MLAYTLRLGFTLALTQVGPEAVARLCPAARLLVVISLGSGVTERSGPHPSPLAGQHMTQTSHARSPTRSRGAHPVSWHTGSVGNAAFPPGMAANEAPSRCH